MYIACLTGTTELTGCPVTTSFEMSPAGRSGCCGSTGLSIDFNCPSAPNENASVYVRVDAPGATPEICSPFVLDYHF
jgi:hypothetical protein